MSPRRAYLDYNATAPLRADARAVMLAAMERAGNPSSVHSEGRGARRVIEDARAQVAALAGGVGANVVFTSGATEAANWVLSAPWARLIISAVEHPAVMAPAERSGARVDVIGVDGCGRVDLAAAARLLADAVAEVEDASGVLVCVQFANNETGVVQPIGEICALVREHGARLMVDAVQAAGRVAINMERDGIDYLVLSSHKIGGPQGAGALVLGGRAEIDALLVGGGQERGRRAGTENVAAIAGFGAAAHEALRDLDERVPGLRVLRDALEAELMARTDELIVFGRDAERLCNTSLVAAPGVAAETAVIALDLAGVAASAGAACSSGKTKRSPVLAAMGVSDNIARCALRFSLGWASEEDDIATCASAFERVLRKGNSERHVA